MAKNVYFFHLVDHSFNGNEEEWKMAVSSFQKWCEDHSAKLIGLPMVSIETDLSKSELSDEIHKGVLELSDVPFCIMTPSELYDVLFTKFKIECQ